MAVLALAVGACSTTSAMGDDPPLQVAVAQPLRDLSLVKEETPALLERARRGPYAHMPDSCSALVEELTELNRLLGPDYDKGLKPESESAAELVAEALGDTVDLPFRGVVRRLTGAHQRDERRAQAVVAGVARRGYLRGLAEERGCEAPSPGAA